MGAGCSEGIWRGKVIKREWDWLGITPPTRAHISGLIEMPDLAACLTLSKNDFIRSGARGASYLGYRKAIQEVISRQLAEWGDTRDAEARPRTARLERHAPPAHLSRPNPLELVERLLATRTTVRLKYLSKEFAAILRGGSGQSGRTLWPLLAESRSPRRRGHASRPPGYLHGSMTMSNRTLLLASRLDRSAQMRRATARERHGTSVATNDASGNRFH